MYDLYSKIIDNLESQQLEDIFRINKLRAKGFNINEAPSTTKTRLMKTILKEKSERRLISIFKIAAETYRIDKNRDYSWASTTTIDENALTEKIMKNGIGEVAFALIVCDKVSLLGKYLGVPQYVNAAPKEKEEEKPREDESLVIKLRKIITNLENDKKKLEEDKQKLIEEKQKLVKDIQKLDADTQLTNTKLIKVRRNYLTSKRENKNLEELLNSISADNLQKENVIQKLREELRQFEIENEELRYLKLLFYGNDSYRKCIDSKVEALDFLKYEYASGGINEIKDLKKYHKLVVLSFTLNTKEKEKLIASKGFNHFGDIGNALFIDSLENLDQYIVRMEDHYGRN